MLVNIHVLYVFIFFLANHALSSHKKLSDLTITNRKTLNLLVYSVFEYLFTKELYSEFIKYISYKVEKIVLENVIINNVLENLETTFEAQVSHHIRKNVQLAYF